MCKAFVVCVFIQFRIGWVLSLSTLLSFLSCLISSWNFHLQACTWLGTVNLNVPFFFNEKRNLLTFGLHSYAPQGVLNGPFSSKVCRQGTTPLNWKRRTFFLEFNIVSICGLLIFCIYQQPGLERRWAYPSGRRVPANLQSNHHFPHSLPFPKQTDLPPNLKIYRIFGVLQHLKNDN